MYTSTAAPPLKGTRPPAPRRALHPRELSRRLSRRRGSAAGAANEAAEPRRRPTPGPLSRGQGDRGPPSGSQPSGLVRASLGGVIGALQRRDTLLQTLPLTHPPTAPNHHRPRAKPPLHHPNTHLVSSCISSGFTVYLGSKGSAAARRVPVQLPPARLQAASIFRTPRAAFPPGTKESDLLSSRGKPHLHGQFFLAWRVQDKSDSTWCIRTCYRT